MNEDSLRHFPEDDLEELSPVTFDIGAVPRLGAQAGENHENLEHLKLFFVRIVSSSWDKWQ